MNILEPVKSQIWAFVWIQAEWENQNKQKSVVHLDTHPPPLLYPEYWASSTASLNSREILGQDGYRNARWVPAHPGTTLTNEKPDAPYLVGTSEAKDQCKRLNRWVGSTYSEKGAKTFCEEVLVGGCLQFIYCTSSQMEGLTCFGAALSFLDMVNA